MTERPEDLSAADAIVLPGVGATRDTMDALDRLGIAENAKITAAHASTGSHAAHRERGVVSADVDIAEW